MQVRTMPFNRTHLKEDDLDMVADMDMGELMDEVVIAVEVQPDMGEDNRKMSMTFPLISCCSCVNDPSSF